MSGKTRAGRITEIARRYSTSMRRRRRHSTQEFNGQFATPLDVFEIIASYRTAIGPKTQVAVILGAWGGNDVATPIGWPESASLKAPFRYLNRGDETDIWRTPIKFDRPIDRVKIGVVPWGEGAPVNAVDGMLVTGTWLMAPSGASQTVSAVLRKAN